MNIDTKALKIFLIVASIPTLIVVVLMVILGVLALPSCITHSGYSENVNQITASYGLNSDFFDIKPEGRFYYEMNYERFYHDVRTFNIYGRISQPEIKMVVGLDWSEKYIVPPAGCFSVYIDLPPEIRNNMDLYGNNSLVNEKTGKWMDISDKKIFLCFLETKNYDIILAIGAYSGTMMMRIYQYPSGKASFNNEANPPPPAPGIYPVVTDNDLVALQQNDVKE